MNVVWNIAPWLLLLLVTQSDGARILGVFPFPSRSHMIVQKALVMELHRRGHEITLITPFPETKPISNYTEIHVEANMTAITGGHIPSNMFELQSLGVLEMQYVLWTMGETMCEYILKQDHIQKIIHSTDLQFDLVIVEAFASECFVGFAHKFKTPIVQVCTSGGSNYMADWVGNPNPYAYVPDEHLEFDDKMNFWERLYNTYIGTVKHIGRQLLHVPKQNAVMQKYFNYTDDFPPVWELEAKTSLVLLNSHYSISYPKPLMPNYVQVGGMHVKPPKKLPQDLQEFLDAAKDGVIYFSMGSNLRSSLMPESKRSAFLQAFSKFKQKVLWKWETDTLPGQPKNVKLGKWLPQSDILAHPNVRVFITHGGLLGSQEAINRGVPLIGIPVYADQSLNMRNAERAGYGVMIDFHNVTTESVTWALKEILEIPRYYENAQHLSRIYRDQPHTPLEQAAFWTEYVIRHKGAPHMRSAVLDLTWYQYFLLDVIAVLTLVVSFVILITFIIIKMVVNKICGGGSRTSENVSTKIKRH